MSVPAITSGLHDYAYPTHSTRRDGSAHRLRGRRAAATTSRRAPSTRPPKLAQEQVKNPPTIVEPAATRRSRSSRSTPAPGEGDINKKPKIPAQTGAAPKDLVAQDVIVGKGKQAKDGDKVSVQYVGVLCDGGKEFDSSWKRKQPFDVTLGAGQVIKGWDEGLVGMQGGWSPPPDHPRRRWPTARRARRRAIPANAALVFDVDLEKIG